MISKINFIDLYDMKKTGFDYGMDLLPKVVYPDIVNYLLFAPSPYTAEQLKNVLNLWTRTITF